MSAEIDRMLANMIRVGVVAELDEANARVKMKVGGLTTDWLPWGAARAGATRTWSAPRPGEQMVVFSPYGDTTQAVVMGSIPQDDHPAPATSKDQERTVYPDGSTVDYNSATNTYTATLVGDAKWIINCKEAIVNAATKVTLATPLVECTHDLKVDGNVDIGGNTTLKAITSNGHNIGDTHKHKDTKPGTSAETSGVPQ